MKKKYTLTMNKEQARVLQISLEQFARIQMGQLHVINEHLPPGKDVAWDVVHSMIRVLKRERFPELHGEGHYHGIGSEEMPDTPRVAWDIYQTVRHAVSYDENPEGGPSVNFHEPMKWGKQPLPTIEITEEADD